MPNPPNTTILTYLSYEDFISGIMLRGIWLPVSALTEKDIDQIIQNTIRDFDSIEGIGYSSFLNMMSQSYPADEILRMGNRELKHVGISNKQQKGIFFHRDNLLHFVTHILRKANGGHINTTGRGNENNAREYYKLLLLISSKLGKIEDSKTHTLFKDYFVRSYPYSYSPETSFTVYSGRLQRYWYIYNVILKSLEEGKKDKILNGLNLIEKRVGISLSDYFFVLRQIFMWFLYIPVQRDIKRDKNFEKLGFNHNNLNSFYINRSNFDEGGALLKLVESISLDLEQYKKVFADENRRDDISGFYRGFQNFFDYPILKMNDGRLCILDLKFLIEGICSGFVWKINSISPDKFEDIKEQYGYLLEEYFIFLVKRMFPGVTTTNKESGQPDAIVDGEGCVIIFEFTTEYYRFASLYNSGIGGFLDDLYKILFNTGKSDKRGRRKKDEGKLIKLNRYITHYKSKKVIPVLVTENILGDYDMLNEFNKFMDNEIKAKGLSNLEKTKPLIMSLDDLETCWAFSTEGKVTGDLCNIYDSWEKTNKGPYHYNLSYFVTEQNDGLVKNEDYSNFYNLRKFMLKDKENKSKFK